jgi:hypothetical protein
MNMEHIIIDLDLGTNTAWRLQSRALFSYLAESVRSSVKAVLAEDVSTNDRGCLNGGIDFMAIKWVLSNLQYEYELSCNKEERWHCSLLGFSYFTYRWYPVVHYSIISYQIITVVQIPKQSCAFILVWVTTVRYQFWFDETRLTPSLDARVDVGRRSSVDPSICDWLSTRLNFSLKATRQWRMVAKGTTRYHETLLFSVYNHQYFIPVFREIGQLSLV